MALSSVRGSMGIANLLLLTLSVIGQSMACLKFYCDIQFSCFDRTYSRRASPSTLTYQEKESVPKS